jgi:hypothetical protein
MLVKLTQGEKKGGGGARINEITESRMRFGLLR